MASAPLWRAIEGKSYSPAEFDAYCAALPRPDWHPAFVVLHNTGAPTLEQRPIGLTRQHLANLETYYRSQRWSAGPHIFVDDHQIWTFSPLAFPGVHSPSWNRVAVGVEMLGDFDHEEFTTGRGAAVRDLTVAALASLHRHLGLHLERFKLHREDPLTTHACPGKNVVKSDAVARVAALLAPPEL